MKLLTLSALLLASTTAMAANYQTLGSINYLKLNNDVVHSDTYGASLRYFLNKKTSLGPLDEFEYINKTSNIYGGFGDGNNANAYQVGGELFVNKWLVGGSYNYLDKDNGNDDAYSLKLGYLISDNLLVKAQAMHNNGDTLYNFSAAYNVQLNNQDYIGFTYNTDDKFNAQTISSKYFAALGNNNFLTAGLSYTKNDNSGDDLMASVGYYFTPNTSVSASYNDNDDYTIGAKHYFNKNYALGVGYSSNASANDIEDYDLYSVNFTAQF